MPNLPSERQAERAFLFDVLMEQGTLEESVVELLRVRGPMTPPEVKDAISSHVGVAGRFHWWKAGHLFRVCWWVGSAGWVKLMRRLERRGLVVMTVVPRAVYWGLGLELAYPVWDGRRAVPGEVHWAPSLVSESPLPEGYVYSVEI